MSENVRVLVVDDEPQMLRAVSRLLRSAGYGVVEASTGNEGLRLAKENRPDLILLDVVLPDVNGIEVCRRIKADAAMAESYVVLISGMQTASESQAEGLEGGADGYIVRPISNRELLARVEALLRTKQAERALRKERDRVQQYLDVAGVLFVVIDSCGEVTLINQKGCEILGYQQQDIVGKNWFDCFLPEGVREDVRGIFNRLMAGEVEPIEYAENAVLTRRGEERIIAWHNTVLRDWAGHIVGTLSSGEDITEYKRAERLLRIQRDLGVALSAISELPEALNQLLEATFRVKGIDSGGVYLVDQVTGGLDLAAHKGLRPEFVESVSHYDADSPQARLVIAGQSAYWQHPDVLPLTEERVRQREELRAVAVIPIKYQGVDGRSTVVGALNLASHTRDEIPVSVRDALEAMAAQIAGVLAE